MQPTTKKLVADVAVFAVSQVVFFYAFKYILGSLDPTKEKRKQSKAKSDAVLSRLGKGLSSSALELSAHEEVIAAEVLQPSEISTTFNDIGGLDGIIESLREGVIYPLVYPQLYKSAAGLLSAPKGVLLYGPPGCGKTMLAKALARESGATFINMRVSTLTDKWFGESNKLVNALFSLARKLQPTIIFIDEIDAFLRERSGNDHEVMALMKAEFMQLWDGIASADNEGAKGNEEGGEMRVLVLGATNRPNDIDAAIMRRMPKRVKIGLPDSKQRRKILKLMLKDVPLDSHFSLEDVVKRTNGLSGSDLKSICSNAALIPVREYLRSHRGELADYLEETAHLGGAPTATTTSSASASLANGIKVRPLRTDDFFRTDGNGDRMEEEGLD